MYNPFTLLESTSGQIGFVAVFAVLFLTGALFIRAWYWWLALIVAMGIMGWLLYIHP